MSEDKPRGRRMPHLDREGIDGEDPMAELGPEDCETDAADVEMSADEREGQAHESEWKVHDEMDEAFPVEQLATPVADDGLPDHSVGGEDLPEAHPFTYETVCCVEDARQYVELFEDEIAPRTGIDGWDALGRPVLPRQRGWSASVDAAGNRRWNLHGHSLDTFDLDVRSRYDDKGHEQQRRHFEPDEVVERWGKQFVEEPWEKGARFVPVRPVRERCRFYKRQHFANDDQPIPELPGHHAFFRNCTHPARRSIGGASLSLRNEAIYGCDYREPYDDKSIRFIDEADARTLESRPHLTRLPLFGLPGDEVKTEEP